MKNKKGFTLIELLAVIIILAIIALIATPIVLNVVENARMRAAEVSITSYVKAIEGEVLYSSLDDKTYEDKDNYKYDEINVDVNGTIPSDGNYSLKEGIVNNGTFCINDYVVEYKNSVSKVVNKGCHNITTKLDGKVKLSSTSGNYVYPNSGSFEVIENISGGTLSCESSNTSVATCSINGTTITVTPGTEKGVATIIVKSEETNNYKEAQAAYVATTQSGLLSVTATGYTGSYDGLLHGITVISSGATIKYGTVEGTYDLTSSPTYKDAGIYTIYYEVTKQGYTTITGSKDVVITKALGNLIVPTAKVLTYTGSAQELINIGSSDTGTIQYKLEGESYSTIIPTAINAGTYKIYYKVVGDSNHNDIDEASIEATIEKANNTLTLSSNTGTYRYPNSGSFEIIKNISGGTLSCESSNTNVATCSIGGTTITVTPGTTEGNTTLTIRSALTTNYNETQVTYVATTQSGLLSVTATGYSGVYDGLSHGITVTSSGATIRYALGVNLNSNNIWENNNTTINENTYIFNNDTKDNILNFFGIQLLSNPDNLLEEIIVEDCVGKKTFNYTHNYETGFYFIKLKANGSTKDSIVMYSNIYLEKGRTYNISYDVLSITSSQIVVRDISIKTDYILTSSPTYKDVGIYTIYYEVTKPGYITVIGSKDVIIK